MMRATAEAWKTWDAPKPGDDLWSWQDGRCAWCGLRRDRMVEDHCHLTGLVRGILCGGCNTHEGVASDTTAWAKWRRGDNTARAIKHYEIYGGGWGAPIYSRDSALAYCTEAERQQWYAGVVEALTEGAIDWPTEAPWVDVLLERKARQEAELRDALDRMPAFGGRSA